MMKPKLYSPRQRRRDYATVFGCEAGQRVLGDLLRHGHILRPTHVRGDTHQTAFREGERNMVLRILAVLGRSEDDMQDIINNTKE